MGRKSTKHQREQVLRQSDFGGGLNLIVNEEALADNELSQAENWEYAYPTAKLKTRDGVTLIKNVGVDIDTLFYADNALGAFFYSSNGTLYKYKSGITTNLGSLLGENLPQFTLWSDKILIASGGSLQSYDGATLDDTGSPDTDIVFTRVGRVVIAKTGTDKLIYSGVGDETNWTIANDGDSLELDIGYKDGGDIISVVPLATDVVVFKSSGSIFRIVGEYPDWAIYEITRSQSALTKFATIQIGNDVFFITATGFMSLKAVQEYGNIKTSSEGYKINEALTAIVDSGARLWNIASKGQIWVRPEYSEYIWVYHINIKAWTKFKMLGVVTGHTSFDDGKEYISIGQKIYMIDGTQDEGENFYCYLKTKKYVSRNQFLLKRITVHYHGATDAVGSLSTGLLTMPISVLYSGDIAYLDDDIAYSDDDVLVSADFNKVEMRTSYRTNYIELFIRLQQGSIILKELILNTVEV